MKLSFKLDDWNELHESLSQKYPDMDECYFVRVKDTLAFTAYQWRIIIPQYGFSVREGAQLQCGEWESVTIIYPQNEKRPSKYDYIYSNTFFESAIAYQAGGAFNENPDCIIDTDEFEVKRYERKKPAKTGEDADTGVPPREKKMIEKGQMTIFEEM